MATQKIRAPRVKLTSRACRVAWLAAVVPALACVQGEGCGNWLGPEGGMVISNAETCKGFWADVRVPEGALDHEVEGEVSCADVPGSFPGESLSPMHKFSPTELRLLKSATFTIQYNGDEDVAVVWQVSEEEGGDWSDLSVELTRTVYSDGRPALRFEFDRFGYFVANRP
jgi:hypothetical protein